MERSFYPFAPPLAFIRLSIRFGRDTIFLFLVDQKSKDNFWPEKLRICHTSVSPISHGSLFVFSDIQCKSNVCASSLQSDSFLKKISRVCLLCDSARCHFEAPVLPVGSLVGNAGYKVRTQTKTFLYLLQFIAMQSLTVGILCSNSLIQCITKNQMVCAYCVKTVLGTLCWSEAWWVSGCSRRSRRRSRRRRRRRRRWQARPQGTRSCKGSCTSHFSLGCTELQRAAAAAAAAVEGTGRGGFYDASENFYPKTSPTSLLHLLAEAEHQRKNSRNWKMQDDSYVYTLCKCALRLLTQKEQRNGKWLWTD